MYYSFFPFFGLILTQAMAQMKWYSTTMHRVQVLSLLPVLHQFSLLLFIDSKYPPPTGIILDILLKTQHRKILGQWGYLDLNDCLGSVCTGRDWKLPRNLCKNTTREPLLISIRTTNSNQGKIKLNITIKLCLDKLGLCTDQTMSLCATKQERYFEFISQKKVTQGPF